VGENVRKTLELLEEFGGPDAYKSIKFSIPLYESCMRSKVIDRSGGDAAGKTVSGRAERKTAAGAPGSLAGSAPGTAHSSKPGSRSATGQLGVAGNA